MRQLVMTFQRPPTLSMPCVLTLVLVLKPLKPTTENIQNNPLELNIPSSMPTKHDALRQDTSQRLSCVAGPQALKCTATVPGLWHGPAICQMAQGQHTAVAEQEHAVGHVWTYADYRLLFAEGV